MTDYAGEEDRVSEWELGLPSSEDLTPLSHQLISPELASAFSISPEPYRTMTDVDVASRSTVSALRASDPSRTCRTDEEAAERETEREREEEGEGGEDDVVRGGKRPRLVWTPQLHKRFVDVVGHLGLRNAVPKTIMQMMNVEGLTRENVASHLQKYRLYLKRMSHDDGESESGGQVAAVMMHVPMVPGHHHHHHQGGGGYAWMDQRREAFGSYHHHRQHAGGNDK